MGGLPGMLANFALRPDLVRAARADARVTINVGVADAQGVDDTRVGGDVAHISVIFAIVVLAVGAFVGVEGVVAVGHNAVAVQVNEVFRNKGILEEAAAGGFDADGAVDSLGGSGGGGAPTAPNGARAGHDRGRRSPRNRG